MTISQILWTEVTLFGLVVGSFLNACIHRLPRQISLMTRSQCPGCGKKIAAYHNIPVVSFLLLRGRCAQCRQTISWQYPLVELITMGFSLLTFHRVHEEIVPYLLWFFLFVAPLICLSVIDIHHKIIPDSISLPGIFAGILTTLIIWWPSWKPALIFSGLGLLVGGGSLLALSQIYYVIRKREGLGGGDIKLCAMLGTFLGAKGMIFIFLISSVMALLFALITFPFTTRSKEPLVLPYGPFLSAAALLFFFYGAQILDWYLSFFHHG